jgi:hypothetical protein
LGWDIRKKGAEILYFRLLIRIIVSEFKLKVTSTKKLNSGEIDKS